MSEATPAPGPVPALETGSSAPIRRARPLRDRPKLDPEARRRQEAVTRLALDHLGSADAIRGFLNEAHPALGARPLDLAIESDAGLAAVTALILVR